MIFPASHLAPTEPERNKEAASLIRQVGDDLNFRLRQLHKQLLGRLWKTQPICAKMSL